jgi:hypothetical protein
MMTPELRRLDQQLRTERAAGVGNLNAIDASAVKKVSQTGIELPPRRIFRSTKCSSARTCRWLRTIGGSERCAFLISPLVFTSCV